MIIATYIKRFVSEVFAQVNVQANIVLALATIALVYVTYQLTLYTKDLRDVAEKQDKKLHESYALTQRPFVTIKNVEARYDDSNSYWFFSIFAENTGNTPTKAMQSFVTYTENANSDPEDALLGSEAEGRIFRGIIGPKAATPLGGGGQFTIALPATHMVDLATKRKDFYIYGVIHYRDWFSETSEHITKFCFAGQPVSKNGLVQVGFLPCRYWNCADDDCKTDKVELENERLRLKQ